MPIFNIGQSNPYKTPVLDASYPANVTLIQQTGGSATFEVKIATAGIPDEYTYQWYVNDSAVSGATSNRYTKTGLTSIATYTVYCKVTNRAGTVQSRSAVLAVQSAQPIYTYSGSAVLIDDGNYNYRIKFLTSGTLKFSHLGCMTNGINVFCVGGGGGAGMSGGGGGYTTTGSAAISANTSYSIVIGAGGAGQSGYFGKTDANTVQGGTTSAFNVSAGGGYNGGAGRSNPGGGNGGSGGSYVGSSNHGGSDGSNSSDPTYPGIGQGRTTREFGESSGTLYAGGGGGGNQSNWSDWGGLGGDGGGGRGTQGGSRGTDGTPNTGGGGGGGYNGLDEVPSSGGGNGGSGIVVIRNKR